jgi:hypothetical protein
VVLLPHPETPTEAANAKYQIALNGPTDRRFIEVSM